MDIRGRMSTQYTSLASSRKKNIGLSLMTHSCSVLLCQSCSSFIKYVINVLFDL